MGACAEVCQGEPEDSIPLEVLRSHDGESDSDSSTTSRLFADISEYAKTFTGEESFEHDAVFFSRWTSFRKGGASGIPRLALAAVVSLLIWMGFLVLYSSGTAQQKAAALWHGADTSIMALSLRNISLNDFDATKKNVSFADYRKSAYVPSFSPIRWLTPAQFPASHDKFVKGYYVTRKDKKLVVLLADSNYEYTVLDSTRFSYKNKFYYAQDVVFNPGQYIDNKTAVHLILTDLVQQWRHSLFSLYWLWKPITGEVLPIQPPSNVEVGPLQKLHFAKFAPLGDYVVFGHAHDLFLVDPRTRNVTTISTNGSPDIFNGKPDWVYEEEVYPHDNMVWWSPDLKRLVYAQINDTNVASYDLDYYVRGSGEVAMSYKDIETDSKTGKNAKSADPNVNQYPKHTSIKYPKPGTANPELKLFTYNLELQKSEQLTGVSDETVREDFLLYDACWMDDDSLLLKVSDRSSSVLEKKLFTPKNSNKVALISVHNASDYNVWIDKASPITLVKKENSLAYLDRIVVDDLVQLALFDLASAQNYSALLGPVNYESALSYDALEECVYGNFGTNLDSSFALVSLKTGGKTILAKDGDYQLNFSPNGHFLELLYAGPQQPYQKIVNLALLADHADFISQIEPNSDSSRLSAVLANTNLPTRIFSSVKIGRHSEYVNMIEIFPPNFKKSEKHPLLMHVYAGPGSTTVTKTFGVDFQDIVSSQLNAVVLIIDPRGTGSDDWKFKAHLKGKLGFWELRDILSITKDYVKANSYIDDQKTAIWGWSYGGFTTLKTLETDKENVFKYGMAVAPVTNWLFYDSVFTERVMGAPKTNPNYGSISRIVDFKRFKEVTRFLIMQGTADDNVHMQNTLWLMDNFDKAGVENYDVHFFPDSDHSIAYHNANTIVYDKLFWWLQRAFGGYFK